jgi:serine acetyltransferase
MIGQSSKNNNLFCGFNVSNKTPQNTPTIPDDIRRLFDDARNTVAWTPPEETVRKVVEHFLTTVEPGWLEATVRRDPALYKHMDLSEADLARFLKGKPPATFADLINENKLPQTTVDEITNEVKTYQGLHAIAFHHVAHALYNEYTEQKVAGDRSGAAEKLLLARQISQGVRRLTAGIEIHPGATIGKNFFIDHGASVVIGETCDIADNVFIYHGVTLGASSGKEIDEGKPIPRRHPKIGEGTVISTGVNILGPITIGKNVGIASDALIKGVVEVGDNASIQAGVVVSHDIPAGANVVGSLPNIPGLIDYNKDPRQSAAGMPILQPRTGQEPPKTPMMEAKITAMRELIGTVIERTKQNLAALGG